MRKSLAIEMIVSALAGLLVLGLTYVLGLPEIAGQAIGFSVVLIVGFLLWKIERFREVIRSYALVVLTLLCMSIVINVIVIALLAQSAKTKSQVCNQVNITVEPDQVTVEVPTEDGVYAKANVVYTLEAPPQTGIRVLLHRAEHLVNVGSSQDTIASGEHIGHYGTYAAAGQSTSFGGAIYMSREEAEKAEEWGSTMFTDRITFGLVSDEGIYCEKPVDVRVRITVAAVITPDTPTPVPELTDTPTLISTPTVTDTPTNTPTPTPTYTPTPTNTATNTPTPTYTPRPPRILLQTFETEGSYYAVPNGQATPGLSNEKRHGGESSLKIIAPKIEECPPENCYHVIGANLGDPPRDVTAYDKICIWIRDERGSNTVELRLIDADNVTPPAPVWSDREDTKACGTGWTELNIWVPVCFKLRAFRPVDLERLGRAEVNLYWDGTYYVDDIEVYLPSYCPTPTQN